MKVLSSLALTSAPAVLLADLPPALSLNELPASLPIFQALWTWLTLFLLPGMSSLCPQPLLILSFSPTLRSPKGLQNRCRMGEIPVGCKLETRHYLSNEGFVAVLWVSNLSMQH